jgi:hypothetical protein
VAYDRRLEQHLGGKVAMWYDATVVAGLLEADNDVKGKNGYANRSRSSSTEASGWLWSWALAIPTTSSKAHLAGRYMDPRIPDGGPRVSTAGHHEAAGPADSSRVCRNPRVSGRLQPVLCAVRGRSSVDAVLAICQQITSRAGRSVTVLPRGYRLAGPVDGG